MTARAGTDHLRVLVDTGIAINSELSLDGVLERIVEAAASVTDAQYAALGVIDRAGTVRHVFNSMTNIGQHVSDALEVVRKLQADQPA